MVKPFIEEPIRYDAGTFYQLFLDDETNGLHVYVWDPTERVWTATDDERIDAFPRLPYASDARLTQAGIPLTLDGLPPADEAPR